MNKWIIFRNVGGVVASGSQAFAISLMPITLYQIIYNTTSFVLLKERIKIHEGFAMMMSFMLIILLAQTR
jgi:drug/metabolite transporter (DMT)-like permease